MTARAGVGGAAVLAAKVFFILSGLVQQALLPRVIGRAGYGALSLVLAPANIVNNVVVAGSTQGASRAVAGAPGHEGAAQRAAMRVHVPVALGSALLFAALAAPIAHFEHAPSIATPLLAMSAVVLSYGLYAPLVGMLNGRGFFVLQAALDVLFATLRTAGLLGLGWWLTRRGGSGVLGSTLGFGGAAVCITAVAWTLVRSLPGEERAAEEGGEVLRGARYLGVLVPLALAQFFTNALMQVDIILLGRFLAEGAPAAGYTGFAGERATDEWVAAYRACQLFAFLPYQLLLSLTQVLFPMLARARVESPAAIPSYVARGARLGAIATGAMVSVIAAMPASALHFAYDAETAARGAITLRVLCVGQGAFAMLGIGCTVLSSLGRERTSAALTAAAATAACAACAVVVPGRAFGEAALVASACCVAATLVTALLVCNAIVRRVAGAFVPAATALRVVGAATATVLVGARLPVATRALAPAVALVLVGVFLVVLALAGELTRTDLAWVVARVRRARGGERRADDLV